MWPRRLDLSGTVEDIALDVLEVRPGVRTLSRPLVASSMPQPAVTSGLVGDRSMPEPAKKSCPCYRPMMSMTSAVVSDLSRARVSTWVYGFCAMEEGSGSLFSSAIRSASPPS